MSGLWSRKHSSSRVTEVVLQNEDGIRGAMLRAYDKMSGEEVGAVFMPARQSGSPMTYRVAGVQYIVVAISEGGYPGELMAFRLP